MTATPDPLLLGELDNARRGVAESRSAITRKLEMLEDRVQETVADVKQAFDFDYQMQQRPWLMVGGSVLVGYMLGRLVSAPRATPSDRSSVLDSPPWQPSVNESRTPKHNSFARIKGEVLDVVTGALWAMAKQRFLPPATPFHGADASWPEPSFNPQMTNPSPQGKPNGHGTM
jgi:ElaB/YqjD/DUF883 family membrane-anchored ribosome-binding protein